MKKSVSLSGQRIVCIKFILSTILFISTGIYAQEKQSITGKLIDLKNNQAVPFASVALIKASGSTPVSGTISDENGVFTISPSPLGNYRLFISVIGYKPVTQNINVTLPGMVNAGIIFLQDTSITIKETVIVGERVKAKSENDKTTYFMTKKLLDASGNGTDVLKLIPGVQIDLMHNISLEGSHNIQILVDGKERDAIFVSQLSPDQIDKVEIVSKSTSNNDGNISGTINIILKKERNSGINGQIYAEIPTSGSQMLIRPAYSLNYGYKKLNLYTSYNGELTYLDLQEKTTRKQYNSTGNMEINSNQYVSQKNWSHRFNYGFDYFLNAHNQINFYAFYNPYSRELDGNAVSQKTGSINNSWNAKKDDTDRNKSTFYSLYYKHDFDKEGRVLTLEINSYNLKAENTTEYTSAENDNTPETRVNMVKPKQNEASIKLDYVSPLLNKLYFGTGMKARYKVLQDGFIQDFNYTEQLLAVYGTIGYKQTKYDINLGGRAEKSLSILKNNFNNPGLSFFPQMNLNYKLTTHQNIQLSYSRSIIRPNIYQLNPFISIDDPYTVNRGNPFLQAELLSSLYLEHSIQFKGNYFKSRLFFNRMNNSIDNLTFINDTGAFETRVNNLGNMQQYGLQFLGSLKLGIVTFNPYFKIYGLKTYGDSLAKRHEIKNRHYLGFDSGLSAILSFKHEFSLSLVFQYSSPEVNIQSNSFSGALYYLSLEKTIKQRFKIGIVSALPFCKNFIYHGSEIDGSNLYSRYDGNVILSQPFCWFKLSYQFNSGKHKEGINRTTEEVDNRPKKGF